MGSEYYRLEAGYDLTDVISCCNMCLVIDLRHTVGVESDEYLVSEGHMNAMSLFLPQKPIFLLLIGLDVDQGRRPLCTIHILEFF